KVNQAIALLLEDGEDKKALESYRPKAALAAEVGKSGSREDEKKKAQEPRGPAIPPAPVFTPLAPLPVTPSRLPGFSSSRILASPLAKRIAAEAGIDVAALQGTGPHGRVVRADVEEARRGTSGGRSGHVRRNPNEYTPLPNGNMRRVIARRLTESK